MRSVPREGAGVFPVRKEALVESAGALERVAAGHEAASSGA